MKLKELIEMINKESISDISYIHDCGEDIGFEVTTLVSCLTSNDIFKPYTDEEIETAVYNLVTEERF